MYDVISIGEVLIDFTTVSVDEMGFPTIAARAGGAPCTFLAALAKYGAKTYIYAKVGDDMFGKLLVNAMKNVGIDTSGVVLDPDVFTTLAFVEIDKLGDRSFSFARKPGADTCLRIDELDLSCIDKSKIFYFDTLPLSEEPSKTTTKKAVEYAKNAGNLILFDPNYRPALWKCENDAKEQSLWGLERADIIKISDEEVEFITGKTLSPKEAADWLFDEYDIKFAMVTSGAKGALLQNKKAFVNAECPPVSPIDTTGAGDIFAGSVISRVIKLGKDFEDLDEIELKDIVKFAVTAASLSTEKYSGMSSVPCESLVYEKMG
ncbi:MAG: carbohydrate kinase [Oscillospiraceae bacterium]|jgi:sugar/nucleoside kinase (ribokinase family)|nr:carbohydrate kinase [Oscillospiraceae bacterium]